MPRFIIIDNYDSFTYNLVHLFMKFDIEVLVFRNDRITVEGIRKLNPDWLCLSPGPKSPSHTGISKEAVRSFAGTIPILGVCLGMQVINEVYGGETIKSPLPVHGKRSPIRHTGEGIFRNVPSPFIAARYHSLCTLPNPAEIVTVATADDDVVMGIQHKELPVFGVQFHPESFMTEHGEMIALNFLLFSPAVRDWIFNTESKEITSILKSGLLGSDLHEHP